MYFSLDSLEKSLESSPAGLDSLALTSHDVTVRGRVIGEGPDDTAD